MVRMTKAQQQWRPDQIKKPKSIKIMFCSTVLTMEAFVVFFGALTVFGLWGPGHPGRWWLLGGGTIFSVIFILCCAGLRKSWGIHFGWALQLLMVLNGFFLPAMFVLGVLFVFLWWYAATKGVAMDAENEQRYRAEIEYWAQREH